MTQSSCKRDTKSKSHPGMKLAPVRVFTCKHPLTESPYYSEVFLKKIYENFVGTLETVRKREVFVPRGLTVTKSEVIELI